MGTVLVACSLIRKGLSNILNSLRGFLLRGLLLLPLPIRRNFWIALMQIGSWLYDPENFNVQRLPFGLYSKVGKHSAREASVMQFLAEKTTISLPKVIDLFHKPGGSQDVIIMTRMPGKPIQTKDITEDQIHYLAGQIRACTDQLRRIPAPNTVIGGFNGTPVQDTRLEWVDIGPFPDIEAFNAFLDSDVSVHIACDPVVADVHDRDYRIVLTHNDIGPLNVMVDEEYKITGLVDWGESGWYPEYWEYTNAIARHGDLPNWTAMMTAAYPEYGLELQAEQILWKNSNHF